MEVVKQAERGVPVTELIRQAGISEQTFDRWKKRYTGLQVDQARQLKQLQAALTDQQQQLKDTQDLVAKNRTDLEGALSSTKDELNGSIATTHEELTALQKRGERNYFEFDIKNKETANLAGIHVILKKTDPKRFRFAVPNFPIGSPCRIYRGTPDHRGS